MNTKVKNVFQTMRNMLQEIKKKKIKYIVIKHYDVIFLERITGICALKTFSS
jgi:flavorubredoxin